MSTSRQAEIRSWDDWTDPDFFAEGKRREGRFIPLFLRQFIPSRQRRTKLTPTGWMLVIVAIGIGSAAYNTASNILFMTLSLMLSSLVLSGILSLINFKRLRWKVKVPEHFQVGEVGVTEIELTNGKRIFPSMSVCFRLAWSESGKESSLYMPNALPAGGRTLLEWTVTPKRRGLSILTLNGVGSKFPFGFLDKSYGGAEEHGILVWPAPIDFTFKPQAFGPRCFSGIFRRSAGLGSDLLNIRDYLPGDAPRLIHWKATARLNKLMIRQLAREGECGFHLEIDPSRKLWTDAQFEILCSLACSLADHLFHSGRLESVRVVGQEPLGVRCMRDLHGFYDQLALLQPERTTDGSVERGRSANCLTFRPLGEGGVAIYVDDLQVGKADD